MKYYDWDGAKNAKLPSLLRSRCSLYKLPVPLPASQPVNDVLDHDPVTLTCVDGALASRRGRYIQVAPALPSGPVGVEVEGATVPCQGWGAVVLRSVDRRA